MGGDEFAIVLEHAPSQEILSENLERFLSDIANLLPEPAKVSCSIGALYFTAPKELQAVYSEADKLLYAAKEQGRACYVIK